MNRIDKKFEELKKSGRKAVSAFLTAGFPRLDSTEALVSALEESGADLFEIGFPFSDPIADGPTIQKSSEAALRNGMNWSRLLETVKSIRRKSQAPLVFMGYANSLFCRGWEASIWELAQAGFDGAIIPDLIPEENPQVEALFSKAGMRLVYLLTPTSSPERMKAICRRSSGFVYCVSVTGVTGARQDLPVAEIKSFLGRVKKCAKIPVLLGFGISKPEHLREFSDFADGFIIGSALIRALESNSGSPSLIETAKKFMIEFDRERKTLAEALK